MAFTKNPLGRKKPCIVAARLSQEDYYKFDSLTKTPGKKQEVIESLVLEYTRKHNGSA